MPPSSISALAYIPGPSSEKRKGALKIHCLYDHSGSLPAFMVVTYGKQHDVKAAKEQTLPVSADSIIAVDRAYIDYKWLYSLEISKVFFVTRAKSNLKHTVIGQHEVNRKQGLLFDCQIKLAGYYKKQDYPKMMRLVGFRDPESGKELRFLTNNFTLSAYTITQIYKARWQIELFFKWIKQNLKIKSFLGTSKNAVLTQIWVAMCYYLLLSYIKYQTKYGYSLLELSRMIAEVALERVSLVDLLSCNKYNVGKIREPDLQYSLF